MILSSFDAVFFTLSFVVPGFILNSTLSAFMPQRTESGSQYFVRFFTFSCVNYAVWSWLIYWIFQTGYYLDRPAVTAGIWFLVILLSPMLIGILVSVLRKREMLRKALQWLGFNPIHPIPTAWDYKFSSIMNPPNWVVVTMKDGNRIQGLFGANSFASSDPTERDVFIEELWLENEYGWERAPRTEGVLISGDDIKHIAFMNNRKEN